MKEDADENPGLLIVLLQFLGITSGAVLMLSIALYEEQLEQIFS